MSRRLHIFAVFLSCAVLGLIFIGGLVTSTHSGLAVPDWPLSYGRVMPPMIGGILFEHGHRLAASAVGFLTILLVLIAWRDEKRLWVKKAAYSALGLVVIQGLFGGLTVKLRLPPVVSIIHACLAQTFFCLTAVLAVWTSPHWESDVRRRAEPPQKIPLHLISVILVGFTFVQLILGAVLRHRGWGLPLHVGNAAVVVLLVGWIFNRILTSHAEQKGLWKISTALSTALSLQIFLGAGAYFAKFMPETAKSIILLTSHVMVGALVLGLSVILALWAYRTRPAPLLGSGRKLADYVTLTKPGISVMTGMTALAGYVLGSGGEWDGARWLHTAVGTILVSGGACALNMLNEIDVDSLMRRTENRPLPARRLLPGEALFLGVILSVAGLVYLSAFVNVLTALLAGLTLSVYIYLYTPLKKISTLSTGVGAVAGALPPAMGWAAATGRLGMEAAVLFAILFFWQFPHFLALGWLYKEDYARAGLSILPVVEPDGESTGRKIVLNSFALLSVSLFPVWMGLAGKIYLASAFVLGFSMMALALMFFREHSRPRARRVFFASIVYLPILLGVLVFDRRYL